MLGLPDTGALAGNTSPKSLHEGQKIMQRWPLGDSRMQSKLESSTAPKFMFEDSKMMDENVSAESSSPEELLQQALQYLGTGCQDQAVPLIRTAIEKNPDLHIALIGMGQTLFSNKLFPEASVCFEHAIPKRLKNKILFLCLHTLVRVFRAKIRAIRRRQSSSCKD
uniref:Uncharacterized protein n=1 Tax=Aegilops tauschii subsp. strangulata TaxID=200361 RepID=A0A453QUZ4_AEGTS